MWLRKVYRRLQNAIFCHIKAIIYELYYQPILLVLQKLMFKPEQYAETSSSFHKHPFQYRDSSKYIDYDIVSQNHLQTIRNLVQSSAAITEESLICVFGQMNKDNDQFIGNLLNELAQQYKRSRLMQQQCQQLQRQQVSQGRRLSQYILQLTSEMQGGRKSATEINQKVMQQVSYLKKVQSSLCMQNKGLKHLVEQYQLQLQVMRGEMNDLGKQLKERQSQVVGLKKQALLLKEGQGKYEIWKQQCSRHMLYQQQTQKKLKDVSNYEELKVSLEALRQGNNRLNQSLQQNQLIVAHLLHTNTLLQAQAIQKDKIIAELSADSQHAKNNFTALKDSTKAKLRELEQAYKRKMNRCLTLLKKEVKSLYAYYIKTKANIQKEILIFNQLNQKYMISFAKHSSMHFY